MQSECIFKTALGRNTVQGEIPGCTPEIVQVDTSQNTEINPFNHGPDINNHHQIS